MLDEARGGTRQGGVEGEGEGEGAGGGDWVPLPTLPSHPPLNQFAPFFN